MEAEHAAAEREAAAAFARVRIEKRVEEQLFTGAKRRGLLELFVDILK